MSSPNWNMTFSKTFRWSVLKTGRYKKSTVGLFETVFNGNCMANKSCHTIQSSNMNHDLTRRNTRHSIGGLFTWPWPLVYFQEHNRFLYPPKMSERQTRAECEHVLNVVTHETFFRLRSPISHKNHPKWLYKAYWLLFSLKITCNYP